MGMGYVTAVKIVLAFTPLALGFDAVCYFK